MQRTIRLPNGRSCTLKTYCVGWRTLKTIDPKAQITGWNHWPEDASVILREIRRGVHDRINRHDPTYGRGRKWDHMWQTETARAARELNYPRLVIHWLPIEWRARFAHRLWKGDD